MLYNNYKGGSAATSWRSLERGRVMVIQEAVTCTFLNNLFSVQFEAWLMMSKRLPFL